MIDIGDKTVVVHLSGGGQSAVCLARCVEWYGVDRVRAVFANTNTEAPDLYDFLDAVEEKFGVKIDYLNNDGMGIWDTSKIPFRAVTDSKLLLMEVPMNLNNH